MDTYQGHIKALFEFIFFCMRLNDLYNEWPEF